MNVRVARYAAMSRDHARTGSGATCTSAGSRTGGSPTGGAGLAMVTAGTVYHAEMYVLMTPSASLMASEICASVRPDAVSRSAGLAPGVSAMRTSVGTLYILTS